MDRAVEVTHTADGITLLLRMPVPPFMQQSLRMTVSCRMM